MKIRALDLFCCAGGAARGLIQAGFEVTGCDISQQPNYPGNFVQGDVFALFHASAIRERFDFVWASPPCQAHTVLRHAPGGKQHEDLIPQTRELLEAAGVPYVIENVVGAPLRNVIALDGSMFDLGARDGEGVWHQLKRERWFEASFPIRAPERRPKKPVIGIYGGHARCRSAKHGGRRTTDFQGTHRPTMAARALGLQPGELTMQEMSQAIPPAFALHIAREFLHEMDVLALV